MRLERAAVAALPEVRGEFPFLVPIALEAISPRGWDAPLLPVAPASVRPMAGVLVAGRLPDPARADEIVVNETARDRLGLDLGTTVVLGQSVSASDLASAPPGWLPAGAELSDVNFRTRLRVVGISKAVTGPPDATPSSGFYAKYGDRLAGFTNTFVSLRHGQADFARFQTDVQRVLGHPVNVANFYDLVGIRKAENVTEVEQDGLYLFALAVILGGAVLVGQALVRAVAAGAADLPTWRAIGADRHMVVRALMLPVVVTAGVAAVTTIVVAIVLSPRFPIGLARQYELSLGVHADWLVLGLASLAVVAAALATAWLSAQWRVTRGDAVSRAPSTAGSWAARAGLPPALFIGARLAVEPGRGRRAVPVRSALVGAIAGVLGVVACFTFRAGIDDAIANPQRSGIVWDFVIAQADQPVAPGAIAAIRRDPDVSGILHATWSRAVPIAGTPTPTFGTTSIEGGLRPVVLSGRAPRGTGEIAFAPTTMKALGLHVGGHVTVGSPPGRSVRIVGTALLPPSSHTDYDQSAWMTSAGLRASQPPERAGGAEGIEDYVLVRYRHGTSVASADRRMTSIAARNGGAFTERAELPASVVDLGKLRALPLALAVFFALLASATVAHAIVTTVRRRKHDLAVMRSIGFTRRQARVAIAWQATLLAATGLVVGVPLGIAFGRVIWRWLADSFPVVYVPPLALVAVLLVVPVALAVANLLAAGPARSAARLRPAEILRTE